MVSCCSEKKYGPDERPISNLTKDLEHNRSYLPFFLLLHIVSAGRIRRGEQKQAWDLNRLMFITISINIRTMLVHRGAADESLHLGIGSRSDMVHGRIRIQAHTCLSPAHSASASLDHGIIRGYAGRHRIPGEAE